MNGNIPLLGTAANTEADELALFDMAAKGGGALMLPLGGSFQSPVQNIIFDHAIHAGRIALSDLRPVQGNVLGVPAGTLMRIFRITDAGHARIKELREKAKIDERLKP